MACLGLGVSGCIVRWFCLFAMCFLHFAFSLHCSCCCFLCFWLRFLLVFCNVPLGFHFVCFELRSFAFCFAFCSFPSCMFDVLIPGGVFAFACIASFAQGLRRVVYCLWVVLFPRDIFCFLSL